MDEDMNKLRQRLTDFVSKERALQEWAAGNRRKGMSTGQYSKISPSVLKELERMLRDTQPEKGDIE